MDAATPATAGARKRPTEIGDSFFLAGVDDDFGVFCREYVVTAIRMGKVHLVEKNRWTFDKSGKLSPSLDDCWRRSFPLGVSGDFAHSPAGAYAKVLPELEGRARALAKIIATVKGQRTRSRPKSKRSGRTALHPSTTSPPGPGTLPETGQDRDGVNEE